MKPFMYSSHIYRDAISQNGPSYIALLLSQAAALGTTFQAGRGKTPEAADQELRTALKAALSREVYPLAIHITGAYFCLPCRLVLSTKEDALLHRRQVHGNTTSSQ